MSQNSDSSDGPQGPSGSFPRRLLVLFAHPALEKSWVNKRLILEAQKIPGVTFHDLYEAYPDFSIHVEREQKLLESHDVIVLQHPIFWYQAPALVKEWLDLVLEHGWAYGSDATALAEKWLLQAVTAGGREESYGPDGLNRQTIREFLRPFDQTARLCGMDYLPPFVVHGTHSLEANALETHVEAYRRFLIALRDDQLDADAVRDLSFLNGPGGPFETGTETEGSDDA
ncbi:MAG: NAD(P)H-dependent oxidoreductase [Acidobacteriota bacterium]